MTVKKFLVLTCVLLRGHRSTHDIGEVLQPILLVALRLASKQEAAVGRFYGDAVLPGAVAVGAGGQAGVGVVAVVLVPQEHLTFGEGILRNRGRGEETEVTEYRGLSCSSCYCGNALIPL